MTAIRFFFPIPMLLLFACKKEMPRFEHLQASQTHIEFVNTLDTTKNYKALYYFYYFNGGGVAAGDINNDGLTDLYFTANTRGANKLYLNKGNMVFEDITDSAGVQGIADWSSGATLADVNADGYLDLYVCSVNNLYGYKGHNALYINNKDNTFTENSAQYGLNQSTFALQSAFFDYDHDGDLDCYILNQSQKPSENLRDTAFRREYHPLSGDILLRNDVNLTGKFTDVTKNSGIYQSSLGYGLGLAIGDLDHDGRDDIFVGNDFHENDYYYRNLGNGAFQESGAAHFNHYSRSSMGNDIADFDNDGQPDIISVDMLPPSERHLKTYSSGEGLEVYNLIISRNGYQHQYSRNCLHRNNGQGASFSDVGLLNGLSATDWSWSPLMADFDNDGLKDIFISSGIVKRTVDLDFSMYVNNIKIRPGQDPREEYNKALKLLPDGASHCFLYQNQGQSGFADRSQDWGFSEMGYFTGAAHADLDNDGDLDLIVNPINTQSFIYQNNAPVKKHLTVALEGMAPNRFGVGAKVWCFTKNGLQYQQYHPVRGFQSTSAHALHFGLDSLARADSLLVVWPDQRYQLLRRVPAGACTVRQSDAAGTFVYKNHFPTPEMPSGIALWQQKENVYNDFNEQFLLGRHTSALGPRLAVSDVNGDGLDDVYACAPSGQDGAMFIQEKSGGFRLSHLDLFEAKNAKEDVDAVFFDANGDNFPDLLVVRGGNVFKPGDPNLEDALFLNDGKGSLIPTPFPQIRVNKSCVAAGDVDMDGDADVFLGVYCQPGAFGKPESSALLLNDGKGVFSPAPERWADMRNSGFVTDAHIADMDGDGRNDLLVAGEWMAIDLYSHKGAGLEKRRIGAAGLWQSVYVTDIDGDGDPDILAGNWGKNSKLRADADHPVKLYACDFDGNGQTDPIITYRKNGQDYPFLGRDELEKVMPVLKKQFPRYANFAGKTVDQIFDLKKSGLSTFVVETTASSLLINAGNGTFARTDLPGACQLSPIACFAPTGERGQYLAGGNFFGVRPYEGRYDACALAAFRINPMDQYGTVLSISGEVRALQAVKSATGIGLLVARNHGALDFYPNSLRSELQAPPPANK